VRRSALCHRLTKDKEAEEIRWPCAISISLRVEEVRKKEDAHSGHKRQSRLPIMNPSALCHGFTMDKEAEEVRWPCAINVSPLCGKEREIGC